LFVQPYIWIAQVNRDDFIDRIYDGLAEAARTTHRGLSRSQTGRLRWYAGVIVAGAVVILLVTFSIR
jgi:NADH-quinone oxidoreductase subunit L